MISSRSGMHIIPDSLCKFCSCLLACFTSFVVASFMWVLNSHAVKAISGLVCLDAHCNKTKQSFE